MVNCCWVMVVACAGAPSSVSVQEPKQLAETHPIVETGARSENDIQIHPDFRLWAAGLAKDHADKMYILSGILR